MDKKNLVGILEAVKDFGINCMRKTGCPLTSKDNMLSPIEAHQAILDLLPLRIECSCGSKCSHNKEEFNGWNAYRKQLLENMEIK